MDRIRVLWLVAVPLALVLLAGASVTARSAETSGPPAAPLKLTSTSTPVPAVTCAPVASPTPIPTPAFTPAPGCSDTPPSGQPRAVITDHPTTTDALFTNTPATCSYRIGLALYRKFDTDLAHQELSDPTLAA